MFGGAKALQNATLESKKNRGSISTFLKILSIPVVPDGKSLFAKCCRIRFSIFFKFPKKFGAMVSDELGETIPHKHAMAVCENFVKIATCLGTLQTET